MSTTINQIVKAGPLPYKHHYMITTTGAESADHVLEPPKSLITIADKYPGAALITYGDGSLGIEIDGNVWAVEMLEVAEHGYLGRTGKTLSADVWQYCRLATGQDGDTCNYGY